MSSGVSVSEDCKTAFDTLKIRSTWSYIIFRIDDSLQNIVVDCKGGKEETFDDFTQKLKDAETKQQGRYAVYDCNFDGSGKKNKLIFIMWCPENLPVKQKMLMASSKEALRKKITGYNIEVEATEYGDISWNELTDKCKKCDKV